MPSIAEVPEYTRKRRREEDDCEQKSGKSCSSYGFFHRAPSPEFSDLNRTLQRPIKPLSNKRQRVIPLNNHEAPKCLYDIMELVGQTRNSDAIEVKKKIDLSPCHICRRKPTSKHELDGFADCEGCGERTCYVCIRECLGSGSAFTDEDMGVGREYDIDPDRDEIEGTQRTLDGVNIYNRIVPHSAQLSSRMDPRATDAWCEADEIMGRPAIPTLTDENYFLPWWGKSCWGFTVASFVDIFFGWDFWWSLLLFPIFQVHHFLAIATFFGVTCFARRDLTSEEALKLVDAILAGGGYLIALISIRAVTSMLHFGDFVLRFLWGRPVWAWTVAAAGFGIWLLGERRTRWTTWIFVKIIEAATAVLWYCNSLQSRTSIYFPRWKRGIYNSWAYQIWHAAVARILLLVLRYPLLKDVPEFEYSILDSTNRHIRLLKLERRIPFLYIQANLITMDLDNPIPYEAISYVWGTSPIKDNPILLNNTRFYLTDIVHSILLRRSSLFRTRYIWIDSICVDQSNISERSSQVRLMREIYQSCYRVYICLGESDTAWLAMALFSELVLLKQVLSREAFAAHTFAYFATRGKDYNVSARLLALIELLHHPWFSRIWVVQEVAVAPSAVILYGNQSFKWDYFTLLVDVLGVDAVSEVSSLFHYSGEEFVVREMPTSPAHAALIDLCRRKWADEVSVPLYMLLRRFSRFKSTDARDKVFALIGLTRIRPLESLINYENGISEVLCLVGDHFLERDELLEVLQFAGIGWKECRDDIPSWVADWSKEKIPFTLAHGLRPKFSYHAATHLRPSIICGSTPKSIKVSAKVIGTVVILGSDIQVPNDDPLVGGMRAFRSWVLEASSLAMSHLPDVYRLTRQPTDEAFWRTLVGDKTETSRPAPASFKDTFDSFMEYGKAMTDLNVDLDDREALSEALRKSEFFGSFDGWREVMRGVMNAGWICWDKGFERRFAVLAGAMMGLVPWGSELGDVVIVPWGSQVPFVVREVPGDWVDADGKVIKRWRLVGECYVHGIMDGEAFEEGFPGDQENFEIF
ncbi:hypothetical protein GLAREA_12281 [Glarea lozoyensis ATCC 20868]|uniref:Heterokaryon incompatibility domain-containing protein n=1 Tax=Glarea lozoyensis (strain ATCC 20868 / MF5171) TaxID=1116229 RepID=S3D0Z1_GLAL2|nr:uncharacterized protein GLAREA_12281 [Glarea lozoyensis ATCC 20868]EPE31525.1 hypothetical protein GLAREA_12281 [Glarea lozoyensis ATCC 20868]